MRATSSAARLAQLFREAGTAHHHSFVATNGDDPAWPAWYAAYLAPPLANLAGVPLSVDHLAADLVIVDRLHRESGPALPWPEYYVEWFLRRYARAMTPVAAF